MLLEKSGRNSKAEKKETQTLKKDTKVTELTRDHDIMLTRTYYGTMSGAMYIPLLHSLPLLKPYAPT